MAEAGYKEVQKRPSRLIRFSALLIVSGIISGASGLIVQYFNLSISKSSAFDQYSTISNITIAALLFGVALFLLGMLAFSAAYLNVFSSEDKNNPDELNELILALQSQFAELDSKVADIASKNTDKQILGNYERIFKTEFKDKFDQKFGRSASEIIKDASLKEYTPQIYKEKSFGNLMNMSENHIGGLQRQIQSQLRTANFNVWAGLAFSIFGLIVMGYIVFEFNTVRDSLSDWTQFLFAFIPKFTFVLLFESISFFFFRAYREDRAMVRYLRNEATNMEEKALGIMASALFGTPESTATSVTALLATERNFIVKKGEKTIIESMQGNNPVLFETLINQILNRLSVGQNLRGGSQAESK
ncbi:hypothetical protein GGQ91_004860 [Methylobacterium fujisawaense]|uniref:MotA/TolQ/ExbB proton channel domain-containing protein n=1 Tax=Methylobacterium fujisawaense TaxID=107400 RepID=A0ABR6DH66_9HYPH|nr:hypothetical protein [Methylobacterium fujisawaense]MBA9065443.1 hypothetical protein [Methylobacterium fujisawaense]